MDFRFPDVGEGIHEGVIVKWHVKAGDTVKRDQVLCEIETDKAIVEIPSPESGVIGKLYHKEGEEVKVGEVLVSYEGSGEEKDEGKDKDKNEVKDQGGVVGSIVDADTVKVDTHGPLFDALNKKTNSTTPATAIPQVLPAIRKLAEELGVDLKDVKPSSADGKISKEDVVAAAKGTGAAGGSGSDSFGEVEYQKLSPVRKTIARHLKKTADEMISVTQMHYCDVTELAIYRKEMNLKYEKEGFHFTFLPFIFMALISAVKNFPEFNAEYNSGLEELVMKKYINLGFAVDTDAGLFVPVIRGAEKKDIKTISKELETLANQVKDRSIAREDLAGASIAVTNYGSVGTVIATPVIYYPNTCIIGVGAIQKTPKLVDGTLVERMILPLAITYDHRFIDGAGAAKFLNAIVGDLENKERLGGWLA